MEIREINQEVMELEFELPDGTEFYIVEKELKEIIEFMRWNLTVEQFKECYSDNDILLIKDIVESRN